MHARLYSVLLSLLARFSSCNHSTPPTRGPRLFILTLLPAQQPIPPLPPAPVPTVSFAVAMARRRKSEDIEPADLLLYLERTW